jgi:peptidoglycan hydrolase CwlO-like protein
MTREECEDLENKISNLQRQVDNVMKKKVHFTQFQEDIKKIEIFKHSIQNMENVLEIGQLQKPMEVILMHSLYERLTSNP